MMIAQYASEPNGADWLILLAGVGFVGALVGAAIGSSKGQLAAGLVLGAILGPVGWIILAFMQPSPEVQHRKMLEQAQMIAAAQTIAAGGYVAPPVPAGWQPDPLGRHAHQWWNGSAWTADVSDGGVIGADPL